MVKCPPTIKYWHPAKVKHSFDVSFFFIKLCLGSKNKLSSSEFPLLDCDLLVAAYCPGWKQDSHLCRPFLNVFYLESTDTEIKVKFIFSMCESSQELLELLESNYKDWTHWFWQNSSEGVFSNLHVCVPFSVKSSDYTINVQGALQGSDQVYLFPKAQVVPRPPG